MTLPDDALLHIFDQIGSFRDATNLCLTNSRILSLGLRRIERLYRSTLAPWSGDRTIAVRAKFRLPRPEPSAGLTPHQSTHPSIAEPDVLCPGGALYAHFESQEPDRPAGLLEGFTPFKPTSDPNASLFKVMHCSPGFKWQRFGGVFLYSYPVTVPWVMCNLTKREYLIARDIESHLPLRKKEAFGINRDELAAQMRGDHDSNLDVALRNVYWSMDVHGPWAGDRISIVTLERAQSRYEDWPQWKEITRKNRWEP